MQKVKIPKRVGRQLYRSFPTILTVVAYGDRIWSKYPYRLGKRKENG